MACDGEIAKEEIAMVKKIITQQENFNVVNIEAIMNSYIASINTNGKLFLQSYLNQLSSQELSEEDQLNIVDFAIQTIFADKKIEYSEVKFFKRIRTYLSLTDEQILEQHPNIEDFLLPDIKITEALEWDNIVFENINLSDNK